MRIYSSGEVAKKLGVSRDSLFGALKSGAPDTAHRLGGRRVFTEAEVERLAEWYKAREMARKGDYRGFAGDAQ